MSKEYWLVLSSGGLRIRQTPSVQGKPLGVLPMQTIIVSTLRQDNWIQHSQGWSMVENGDKQFAKSLAACDYPAYEVVSKAGLRSREAPSATAKETVILPNGATVYCLEKQDFWVRHPEGWSMMHSDPSKGGEKKVFLQEKGGGKKEEPKEKERESLSPPPEVAVAPKKEEEPPPRRVSEAKAKPMPDFDRPFSAVVPVNGKEEATEADLDAYKETLRAMCLDDRLSADELRFLAEMRRQRMIKEKQHFQALNELGITKERFTQMIKNDRDQSRHFAGRECVTCMDSMAEFIVLRCFHLCLCERCANELKIQPAAKQKCPKCGVQFTEIQKVY